MDHPTGNRRKSIIIRRAKSRKRVIYFLLIDSDCDHIYINTLFYRFYSITMP